MDITHQLLGPDPIAGMIVIGMLVLIEGILSVDNAAVLATMVMKLPRQQRGKALRYGIIGAYGFRGLCLALASWLMTIWWLEPLGGMYLLWLAWAHFRPKSEEEPAEAGGESGSWLFRQTMGRLGPFWATVVAVEVMDLAFSIDNVLAAVAYVKEFPNPSKLFLVCTGVFLGILTMRFAAQGFVSLMQRFPFLETCAYIVIGILGGKLMLSVPRHFMEESHAIRAFLESKYFDMGTSVLTVLIFVIPILVYWVRNRGNGSEPEGES